ALFMVLLILLAPSVGNAQITTTITSSGPNTQVTQVGNAHSITGGTRPGGGPNLFHSFGNFTVGTGDLANFSNNTGLPTSNILGRVTGGTISTIDGTIQTTGFGNANLFLMNPSGIVIGPGASLNVGGSVSFTTAQYLRLLDGLSNGALFYASPGNDGLANSILTI
ncbi:MAG TPA: filamentous hemagglutinin, partial [Nitrospira sp.]|nr:filamentous hemagglutinin [Nitrospira sp.]